MYMFQYLFVSFGSFESGVAHFSFFCELCESEDSARINFRCQKEFSRSTFSSLNFRAKIGNRESRFSLGKGREPNLSLSRSLRSACLVDISISKLSISPNEFRTEHVRRNETILVPNVRQYCFCHNITVRWKIAHTQPLLARAVWSK